MSGFGTALNMRRAGAADAEAIRQLTRAVYAKWIPLIGREPMPMQVNYNTAVLDHWIDLAEVEGSLVGLVEMIPNADHLFIENLAVAEAMQGRGFATALLHHAEKLAHTLGLPEVQLATNEAFADNLRFYGNRGYELYETKAFHLGGVGVRFRKRVS